MHNKCSTFEWLREASCCAYISSWWRHQMETFSALLAIGAGNSPVPGEFPAQRPVTRSFDVFFDLRLNKRLRKQSWCWWFETLSRPLWRHRNVEAVGYSYGLTNFVKLRLNLLNSKTFTDWRRPPVHITQGMNWLLHNISQRHDLIHVSKTAVKRTCFAKFIQIYTNTPTKIIE